MRCVHWTLHILPPCSGLASIATSLSNSTDDGKRTVQRSFRGAWAQLQLSVASTVRELQNSGSNQKN